MDLFDFNNYEETAKPLSERMRANTLNEFIGQKHLVAEGSLLRRAIASDRLGSCIFWGPPGCGKTTLANIIAMTTNDYFYRLNHRKPVRFDDARHRIALPRVRV